MSLNPMELDLGNSAHSQSGTYDQTGIQGVKTWVKVLLCIDHWFSACPRSNICSQHYVFENLTTKNQIQDDIVQE